MKEATYLGQRLIRIRQGFAQAHSFVKRPETCKQGGQAEEGSFGRFRERGALAAALRCIVKRVAVFSF